MTTKINSDTSDGLKITSDTSGVLDIQSAGTTKMTVGSTIDIQGNELVLDADADTSIHASTDDQIDFKTGGSDRMVIDSSGKVGIGTTSPAHMLHVKAGDSRVRTEETGGSTTFDMTNTSGGHFLDSSGTNDLTINKSGSANMAFKTANTERMRINSAGDVGIGTTSPRNELTVDGVINGITRTTSSGSSNTTIKSGMSGAYLVFITWNNGSGYATLMVSTALSSSGVIISSSNSTGGNNAFDVTNSFSSNSGNGLALFLNGEHLNLQTKNNWSANAHPVRINVFGG